MIPVVVGIDPGLSGAIAYVGPSGDPIARVIPVIKNGTRRSLDLGGIRTMFAAWKIVGTPGVHVFLERAQPMPRDGAMGAFRYGESYGMLVGCLDGLGLEVTTVHPATWKSILFSGTTRTKDDARALAAEVFPSMAPKLVTKVSHNMAEALLLAEYGRRVLCGKVAPKTRKTKLVSSQEWI